MTYIPPSEIMLVHVKKCTTNTCNDIDILHVSCILYNKYIPPSDARVLYSIMKYIPPSEMLFLHVKFDEPLTCDNDIAHLSCILHIDRPIQYDWRIHLTT